MALAMIFGVAMTAQAVNTVQMTLTSPAIVKKGCELVGSATFGFDANSVIQNGDWWYMDLPSGTAICNNIDYVIFGSGAAVANGAGSIDLSNLVTTGAAANIGTGANFIGTATTIPATAPGVTVGPFSTTSLGAAAAPTPAGGNMVIRVLATQDTNRIWMYVYSDVTANLTVGTASRYNIKILTGDKYQANLLMDDDGDMIYGNSAAAPSGDTIRGNNPTIENSLCVNAELMNGDLMFTSFDSKENKFTFTGDSQIAHVASANPLALAFCKGATTGNILIGEQNKCQFVYEKTTSGYCAFTGNRILIEGASTFGNPGDRYDMTVRSETAGVYFKAAPSLYQFTPSEDECSIVAANATAVTGAGSFRAYNEAGTANATYPDSSCAVGSTKRVREVRTNDGKLTGIHTADTIWVDLPAMVYDTTVIGNGTEAQITVILKKHPCGEIFNETTTIGTFVTTCPITAGSTSTLLFPWFPPMDGNLAPWWGGFVIINGGGPAGTADLTFWEVDGDTATYTTPSIPLGGQWNAGQFADLLGDLTPGAGNTGTLGDANFAVTVECNFLGGAGFAFTGNGIEATGYTAYVGAGGMWQ